MSAYLDEKRRRIEQFAQYLRLMGIRRHKVVKDDCFIIFDETPSEDANSPNVKESAAVTVFFLGNGDSVSGGEELEEPQSNDWHGEESQPRFLQFAFLRDCFYMELPNNTVFPPEAEKVLRDRLGFYWAKNRPDLCWVRGNWKEMVKWEPLQKVYLYRDEESAAEDMAFILFEVWNFPVDSAFWIKAAAFHTDHRFEHGKRID